MQFLKNLLANFAGILLLVFSIIIYVIILCIAMLGWLFATFAGIFFGIWWGVLLFFVWILAISIFITYANT